MMTNKAQIVLNGWLQLSQAERQEFAAAVAEYNAGTQQKRTVLSESSQRVMKMETGPLGHGCPCCGR